MDLKRIAKSLSNPKIDFGEKVNDTKATSGMLGNVRAAAALMAEGNEAGRANKSLAVGANQVAAEAEMARQAAERKKKEELAKKEQEIEDLQNPDNYKAVVNDVGGYDFYDPLGNKINAVQYARKKNMQLSEVYKGSQDPNDQDFLNSYDKVLELGKIIQSGDKEERDKFFEKNPKWKEVSDMPLSEIVSQLHEQYPGYFRSPDQKIVDDTTGAIRPNQVGATPTDQRNRIQRITDQLIPSFLGNTRSSTRWW